MLVKRVGADIPFRDHVAVSLRPGFYPFLLASPPPHASLAAVNVPGSHLLGSMVLTGNLA
jgi:hypothetical protein